jgi:ribonuclease-3
MFEVKCSVPIITDATRGAGISRKKAEQAAAENMLILLEDRD